MSRFYASIYGDRSNEVGRQGFSGIRTHTRGWDVGVEVLAGEDEHGNDVLDVYVTQGSNRPMMKRWIMTVHHDRSITIAPSELNPYFEGGEQAAANDGGEEVSNDGL